MEASTTSKPPAVVTGASSGIGLELAKQFAGNSYDLVIAAEDTGLSDAAEALSTLGAQVEAVHVDLAAPRGRRHALRADPGARPAGRRARAERGIGAGDPFAQGPDADRTDLTQELEIVDLNVRSTVHLAKHVIARHDGARRGPCATSSRTPA